MSSYQTPWSSILDVGSYQITVVDTEMNVGGQQYVFKRWQDQTSLENPRLVSLGAGQAVSLIAVYEPITTENITPKTFTLPAGSHTITMPATATIDGIVYHFQKWEDNGTNPVRTLSLTESKTITAYYTTTPIPSGFPIWIVIPTVVIGGYFVMKRKGKKPKRR